MTCRSCIDDSSMNYRWIIDELSMMCRWFIDELSMNCRWIIHELSIHYRWLVDDLSMVCQCIFDELSMTCRGARCVHSGCRGISDRCGGVFIFWWLCRFIGTNAYITCWFAKMSIGVCNLHRDSGRDFCNFCQFCRMHVVVGSSRFRIGFCIDYLGILSLCMFSLISLVFWSNAVYTIF